MKLRSLAELKTLQKLIAQRAAAEAAAREAERLRLQRMDRETRLFELAVGPVRPLGSTPRVHHPPRPVEPAPRQRQLDEASVMREALSDDFDVETLLHTDDQLSFRRPGLGPAATRNSRVCAACAWCTAKAWARRAARPCSRAGCSAGWCRKTRCWPSCRRGRPRVAPGRWWCCCGPPDRRPQPTPPDQTLPGRLRIQSAVLKKLSFNRVRRSSGTPVSAMA